MYILGLDLGQSQDYTALCIIEKLKQEGGAVYHVRKLERTRGTPYPDVVSRVKAILEKLSGAVLVVDQTGVGAPVVDMFTQADLKPIGIYIHGGDKATHEGNTWRVPKRDLVGVLQVLLQNQKLKIAPGPLSDILANEMLNFRVKIDPVTAHDSYSAWREQEHDDLVLAVALAAWWGEHCPEIVMFHIPEKAIMSRPLQECPRSQAPAWLRAEQARLWGND
jgi:hypothetical protein